jgi:hypothetical protein
MQLFGAITDYDCFRLHAAKPNIEEVNFWRPSPTPNFKAQSIGEPLLFKLHSPQNSSQRWFRSRSSFTTSACRADVWPGNGVCSSAGAPSRALKIDPDKRRLNISRRIPEECHNGREYDALQGRDVAAPLDPCSHKTIWYSIFTTVLGHEGTWICPLRAEIRRFRDERDWKQFHNPRTWRLRFHSQPASCSNTLLGFILRTLLHERTPRKMCQQ